MSAEAAAPVPADGPCVLGESGWEAGAEAGAPDPGAARPGAAGAHPET